MLFTQLLTKFSCSFAAICRNQCQSSATVNKYCSRGTIFVYCPLRVFSAFITKSKRFHFFTNRFNLVANVYEINAFNEYV